MSWIEMAKFQNKYRIESIRAQWWDYGWNDAYLITIFTHSENVSRIIRGYKGRCSFEIRKTFADFAWQSLFHDRIIRDAAAYQPISNFNNRNPENWKGNNFISP